jgi:hypothetical protein
MTVNRRTALALLGAGVLASRLEAAQAHLHAIRRNTESRRLIFFDPEAHRLIDALAEAIIPSDDHSPGAREAGVSDYIDLVAGNSAAAEQEQWRTGMAAFEAAARSELGNAYLDATPAEQAGLLNKLGSSAAEQGTPAGQFFARMKRMTVFGYYTSQIGLLKELEYKGNQALAEFPGCKTDGSQTGDH